MITWDKQWGSAQPTNFFDCGCDYFHVAGAYAITGCSTIRMHRFVYRPVDSLW